MKGVCASVCVCVTDSNKMNLLLILFTLISSMSRTITLEVIPKLNITIKTPESNVIPIQVPYVNIHRLVFFFDHYLLFLEKYSCKVSIAQ